MKKLQRKNLKRVKLAYSVPQRSWVGDGFYVHGLLRPSKDLIDSISPFILMDYAGPMLFPKTVKSRGVGEHPHRGFETVTLAYQGEIEHRDSSGGGGLIKSGDVQWMTAGSGIVHDEFHSSQFSSEGGVFEMVQLWVNLPKKYKMTRPKYQNIENSTVPKVKLGLHSHLRIIAGEYQNIKGPASTFTPINMYDLSSDERDLLSIKLEEETNTILLIMSGEVRVGMKLYEEQSILIFEQGGESIDFDVTANFKGLLLNGVPIDEPVVAEGPFVMNTKEEIREAIKDYQNGKMGQLKS